MERDTSRRLRYAVALLSAAVMGLGLALWTGGCALNARGARLVMPQDRAEVRGCRDLGEFSGSGDVGGGESVAYRELAQAAQDAGATHVLVDQQGAQYKLSGGGIWGSQRVKGRGFDCGAR